MTTIATDRSPGVVKKKKDPSIYRRSSEKGPPGATLTKGEAPKMVVSARRAQKPLNLERNSQKSTTKENCFRCREKERLKVAKKNHSSREAEPRGGWGVKIGGQITEKIGGEAGRLQDSTLGLPCSPCWILKCQCRTGAEMARKRGGTRNI